jgi:aspartate racemase
MRTIGLIGGMSWESSAEYYRLINEGIKQQLGGLHSAKLLLYSVDFAEVEVLQMQGRWKEAGELLADAARRLERAGADGLVLCTNTMHKLAETIEAAVEIPLLHIADATADRVRQTGLKRVGLLGTRFTMEEDFYKGRLQSHFGLEVVVPDPIGRQKVHDIIYHELCLGTIRDESRLAYRQVIAQMAQAGAQGIILGCTEIGLLVGPQDSQLPLFDTTRIHAELAVQFMLSEV